MKKKDILKFKTRKSDKKESKKSDVSKILFLIVLVFVIWLGSITLDVLGLESQGEKVMLKIREGCTVKDIAELLADDDVVDYAFAFRLYEKLDGAEHLYQQGGHWVNSGMSYGEILEKISQKPDLIFDQSVKVTIPEGFENRQIADKLASLGLADKDVFMEELETGDFDYEFIKDIEREENRLEGYLFPATYDILPGESEHDIICRMLDSFETNILPLYESADTDMTLDEVVTFASVVEREAANDRERPIVASVFYNRMAKDMTLSSCATVQYILQERKDVLSTADTKIKSDYNTYMNKGLPVGPIASPGANSVKAVLDPAETDYLYFAARADGSENVFAKTDEEHMNNVKELQGK